MNRVALKFIRNSLVLLCSAWNNRFRCTGTGNNRISTKKKIIFIYNKKKGRYQEEKIIRKRLHRDCRNVRTSNLLNSILSFLLKSDLLRMVRTLFIIGWIGIQISLKWRLMGLNSEIHPGMQRDSWKVSWKSFFNFRRYFALETTNR